jgi:hypothetical protein
LDEHAAAPRARTMAAANLRARNDIIAILLTHTSAERYVIYIGRWLREGSVNLDEELKDKVNRGSAVKLGLRVNRV